MYPYHSEPGVGLMGLMDVSIAAAAAAARNGCNFMINTIKDP